MADAWVATAENLSWPRSHDSVNVFPGRNNRQGRIGVLWFQCPNAPMPQCPNAPMPQCPNNQLSEKPLGYILASLGGILGEPIGMFASLAVLFGIIGVPSCLAFFGVTTETATRPSDDIVASRPPAAVPLGIEAKIRNDRSLKVTSSRTYSQISSSNPFLDMSVQSKGGKLIAVFMTVKNTGQESGNLFWTKFQLRDSQERIYDSIEDFQDLMIINMWAEEQGFEDAGNQLFPGGTAEIVVVFRVSPDAENLTLIANNKCCFAITRF